MICKSEHQENKFGITYLYTNFGSKKRGLFVCIIKLRAILSLFLFEQNFIQPLYNIPREQSSSTSTVTCTVPVPDINYQYSYK